MTKNFWAECADNLPGWRKTLRVGALDSLESKAFEKATLEANKVLDGSNTEADLDYINSLKSMLQVFQEKKGTLQLLNKMDGYMRSNLQELASRSVHQLLNLFPKPEASAHHLLTLADLPQVTLAEVVSSLQQLQATSVQTVNKLVPIFYWYFRVLSVHMEAQGGSVGFVFFFVTSLYIDLFIYY